jgi:hypothetical protein
MKHAIYYWKATKNVLSIIYDILDLEEEGIHTIFSKFAAIVLTSLTRAKKQTTETLKWGLKQIH